MLLIGLVKIKLGFFLDLNVQIVELLYGSVAGKEILRSGPEGNDLKIL